jgi:hypothetical protein
MVIVKNKVVFVTFRRMACSKYYICIQLHSKNIAVPSNSFLQAKFIFKFTSSQELCGKEIRAQDLGHQPTCKDHGPKSD